mgnify:CR=1 FL=1
MISGNKTKRLKLLFCYSADSFGGITRSISHLVEGLAAKGVDCHVMLISAKGQDSGKPLDAILELCSFTKLDSEKKLDCKLVRCISNYVKANDIDVITLHGYKANLWGLVSRIVKIIPCPMATILHGWPNINLKISLYHLLDKFVVRFFDRIVLVSPAQKLLTQLLMLPKSKLRVIPNGISSSPSFHRATVLDSFGIPNDSFVICYAGRLCRKKNIGPLVEAYSLIQNKLPNSILLIVGDGEELDKLTALAKRIDVRSIKFTGSIPNAREIIAASDIFCSLSKTEGLPNTVLEAMSGGVPCILSNIRAHQVLANSSEGVILVDEVGELADWMVRLHQDNHLKEQLGASAKESAQKFFSLQTRIDRFYEMVMELVGPKRND